MNRNTRHAWRIAAGALLVAMAVAGAAEAVPTPGAVPGLADLSTYKFDVGDAAAGWATVLSFGAATDTTYVLGFEGCVATCSGGTADVSIQYLGDPSKDLDSGSFWLGGRPNANPRAGLDRIVWDATIVPAGRAFDYGYGGLFAIRVKGAGAAGVISIFVSKRCPK